MKIIAVCGHGLGSSLMLSMNIQDVLKNLGVSGVQVEHSDISSASGITDGYIVCGSDIAMVLSNSEKVIALESILDKKELTEKLSAALKTKGVLP
jgi:PTS system ascorbate-specific IIB component